MEVEDAVAAMRLFERPVLPMLTHGMCEPCFREMLVLVAEAAG
jgi:hypothetical protein